MSNSFTIDTISKVELLNIQGKDPVIGRVLTFMKDLSDKHF